MNTHYQRFRSKIYSIKQKIPVYREDNWLKIHQKWRDVVKKVTEQGKMCGFSTTIIGHGAFEIFTRYENFSIGNWYHKATAPILTVLFTLYPLSWCNVMELIQNWDNQNQQAKSFQMKYNWSKLNYQNYQTLTWVHNID